jgi:hypothetical protein
MMLEAAAAKKPFSESGQHFTIRRSTALSP